MAKGKNGDNNTEEVQDLGAAENAPATEALVSVRALVNDISTIGSDEIILEKGKTTKVTAGQAMILQGANKVISLH